MTAKELLSEIDTALQPILGPSGTVNQLSDDERKRLASDLHASQPGDDQMKGAVRTLAIRLVRAD